MSVAIGCRSNSKTSNKSTSAMQCAAKDDDGNQCHNISLNGQKFCGSHVTLILDTETFLCPNDRRQLKMGQISVLDEVSILPLIAGIAGLLFLSGNSELKYLALVLALVVVWVGGEAYRALQGIRMPRCYSCKGNLLILDSEEVTLASPSSVREGKAQASHDEKTRRLKILVGKGVHLDPEIRRNIYGERSRDCPNCKDKMTWLAVSVCMEDEYGNSVVGLPQAVDIDACDACKLIWCERTEFDLLRSSSTNSIDLMAGGE